MSAPFRSLLACYLLSAPFSLQSVEWHHPLSLANHGYWRTRVAVSITNASTNAAAGIPVSVQAAELTGVDVKSIRACTSAGVELLFDVRTADGTTRREGKWAPDDTIVLPVECAAGAMTTLFVYADNAQAWPVPDHLNARMGDAAGLLARAGRTERLTLESMPTAAPQFSAQWPVCAEVRVLNTSTSSLDKVLVLADLRPTLGRWLKLQPNAAVKVVDAGSGEEIAGSLRSRNELLFPASLGARTVRTFFVYLSTASQPDDKMLAAYGRLIETPANAAPNPGFEQGTLAWTFPSAPSNSFSAAAVSEARFGQSSLRFTVPADRAANWAGWQSKPIPVRPGATYFYSGFIKSTASAPPSLHAHWLDKDGRVTSGGFAATSPVEPGGRWGQSSAVLQAPPGATSIALHLTVNTPGTIQHDGILFCEVVSGEVLRLATADSEKAAGPALRVAQVNPLIKVFQNDPAPPSSDHVRIECARNEYEPVQLVATSTRPLQNVRVTVSPLRGPGGATLPDVKVDRIGYVPVDHPSAYYSSKASPWERKLPFGAGRTDGWAGNWPDPLIPATHGTSDVAPGQNQPFWLTIRSASNTPPGEYRAEIVVRADDAEPVAVPLTLTVLPYALPDRTRLRAILDHRFGPGGKFGGANTPGARRNWLRFLAEHRLGVDQIEPEPVFTYTNGTVRMDAQAFDETARYCFDELGMSVAYTPRQFYMFGWAYPPKKLFGLDPFTPEWTSAFKQAYGLFTKHIQERGWRDRFVYYISDEPHFDHGFVVDQMTRLCTMIHEVDSRIPIYSSTWRHCPAWDKSLDLWGVGQHGTFSTGEMEQVLRSGKQFWFTCDGQMATDTPYLATERMLPYYSLKYGAAGFEFWGVAWWTHNPWKTGWHTFIRQSDDGKAFYWTRYPNGDGYLAYPGQFVGVDGPVSTIRLEQIREGLEDFEAMSLLRDLVGKSSPGPAAAEGRHALAMANDLVSIPNASGLRSTEILPDPDRIPAIRRAVNAAIVKLMYAVAGEGRGQ